MLAPDGRVYITYTASSGTVQRFDSVAVPVGTLAPGTPVTVGGPVDGGSEFLLGFGAAAMQAGGVSIPTVGFNTDQSLPTPSQTITIQRSEDGGQTWTTLTPAGTFSNQAVGAVLIGPMPGVFPDDALSVVQDGAAPNITTTFNEFSTHP